MAFGTGWGDALGAEVGGRPEEWLLKPCRAPHYPGMRPGDHWVVITQAGAGSRGGGGGGWKANSTFVKGKLTWCLDILYLLGKKEKINVGDGELAW